MTDPTEQIDWQELCRKAGPYPVEAFHFVRDGLSYTVQRNEKHHPDLSEADRHVSGQELCLGLREFAIESYGLLAMQVLDHWRIRRTDDFGKIVFAMIDAELMSKTPDDSLDDFRGVYDFREAFNEQDLMERLSARSN